MESIHEGYLVKSPPEKRAHSRWKLFRAKWRRRYFVLYAPPAVNIIPGMCTAILDYYSSKDLHRKQGSIDLTNCEEVLAQLDATFYQNVFGLQTKHKNKDRTYYLAAETEQEMNDWVSALCWVLGMKENFEQQQQSFFQSYPPRLSQPSISVTNFATMPRQPPRNETFPTNPHTSSTTERRPRACSSSSINEKHFVANEIHRDNSFTCSTVIPETATPPPDRNGRWVLDYVPPPPMPRRSTVPVIEVPSVITGSSHTITEYDFPKRSYTNSEICSFNDSVSTMEDCEVRLYSSPTNRYSNDSGIDWSDLYKVPPSKQESDFLTYNIPRSAVCSPCYDLPPKFGKSAGHYDVPTIQRGYHGSMSMPVGCDWLRGQSSDVDVIKANENWRERKREQEGRSSGLESENSCSSRGSWPDEFPADPKPRQAMDQLLSSPPAPSQNSSTKVHLYMNAASGVLKNKRQLPTPPPSDEAAAEKRRTTSDEDFYILPDPPAVPVSRDHLPLPPLPDQATVPVSRDQLPLPLLPDHATVPVPRDQLPLPSVPDQATVPVPRDQLPLPSVPDHATVPVPRDQLPLPSLPDVPASRSSEPLIVIDHSDQLSCTSLEHPPGYDQLPPNPIQISFTKRSKSFRRTVIASALKEQILLPIPTKGSSNTDDSSSSDNEEGMTPSIEVTMDKFSNLKISPFDQVLNPLKGLHCTPPAPKNPETIKYLDLDLQESSPAEKIPVYGNLPSSNGHDCTEYKEIDFDKTRALVEMRREVENKRRASEKIPTCE